MMIQSYFDVLESESAFIYNGGLCACWYSRVSRCCVFWPTT